MCAAPAESPALLGTVGRALAQVLQAGACGDFTAVEAVVGLARLAVGNTEALLSMLHTEQCLSEVLQAWLDRADCILTIERCSRCQTVLTHAAASCVPWHCVPSCPRETGQRCSTCHRCCCPYQAL